MNESYSATREVIRDILTPYGIQDMRAAHKELKELFGPRWIGVSSINDGEFLYKILCYGEVTPHGRRRRGLVRRPL